MTCASHSGRSQASRVPCSRPLRSSSSRIRPGFGSALCRMWWSMSNCSSSTHTSWPRGRERAVRALEEERRDLLDVAHRLVHLAAVAAARRPPASRRAGGRRRASACCGSRRAGTTYPSDRSVRPRRAFRSWRAVRTRVTAATAKRTGQCFFLPGFAGFPGLCGLPFLPFAAWRAATGATAPRSRPSGSPATRPGPGLLVDGEHRADPGRRRLVDAPRCETEAPEGSSGRVVRRAAQVVAEVDPARRHAARPWPGRHPRTRRGRATGGAPCRALPARRRVAVRRRTPLPRAPWSRWRPGRPDGRDDEVGRGRRWGGVLALEHDDQAADRQDERGRRDDGDQAAPVPVRGASRRPVRGSGGSTTVGCWSSVAT